jgi:hypothetical protein
MAGDEGILASTAQVLLAIGQNASAEQILEANTNIWIKYAEADMEKAFGNNIGLVENYTTKPITAALKQWLAVIAANRAAWYAINQNQNTWGLRTTQSKLNVLDASWSGFLSEINNKKAGTIADLNL